jgi:hypothetical protein
VKSVPIYSLFFVALLTARSVWGEPFTPPDPILAQRVEELTITLTGKDLRHRRVLEWLRPLLLDPKGAERLYLSFLSGVEKGTGGAELVTLTPRRVELSALGGYAEIEFQACGRFLLVFLRCVEIETSWRKVEPEGWFLLPPESLLLETPF